MSALTGGKTGDPCLNSFKCNSVAGCCETVAYCEGKTLTLTNTCTLCPMKCSADSDCDEKSLCENYQCHTCPDVPCPATWLTVLRNKCTVCVPPNECNKAGDSLCGERTCVAGLSCLPNCNADPLCCFGNRCLEPQCTSVKELDCLVVGCPAGSFCKAGGAAKICKCQQDTGTFACNGNSSNTCNPY